MRTMNKDLTYSQWQKALAEPAHKVSDWFEDMLHKHFGTWADKNGGSVRRNPTLPNRSTPDFLIEDGKGQACYVEAKALFGSMKKSDYFEWRVDLSALPASRVQRHCPLPARRRNDAGPLRDGKGVHKSLDAGSRPKCNTTRILALP